jgi:hypothetical protein
MDLFRKQFSQNALFWVNRISGLIIVGFGVFALWGAIMGVA